MNYFDSEANVISHLQELLEVCEVLCIPIDHFETDFILDSLLKENWKDWTDSSSKNAPPPDYYNSKLNLMLEVMRIDDHAREVNGKIYNPTNIKESKLQKELLQLMKENRIPKCNQVIVNAISDLPTLEDHNYDFYLKNFKRVIDHHSTKIPQYKANHPGYKTIFLVFDESSEYVQVRSKSIARQGAKQGQPFHVAKKHIHYVDKAFLNCFLNTDIDYLIWFAPNKCQFDENGIAYSDMPIITIYDVKNIHNIDFEEYNIEYMMSVEE